MKKFFVIVVLFALPLVAYLFFASGVNHFARLPVMTENLYPLEHFDNPDGEPLSFNGNITILSFPGERPEQFMVNAYHLAEKIYDPYSGFHDLFFVSVVPEGTQEEVVALKKELEKVIDLDKWRFVSGTPEEIRSLFASLKTDQNLDTSLFSPNAFIIDKRGRLRGRQEDKDGAELYGYDTGSVAVLNNKMDDDVKVILAEYRLELKKNKASQTNAHE